MIRTIRRWLSAVSDPPKSKPDATEETTTESLELSETHLEYQNGGLESIEHYGFEPFTTTAELDSNDRQVMLFITDPEPLLYNRQPSADEVEVRHYAVLAAEPELEHVGTEEYTVSLELSYEWDADAAEWDVSKRPVNYERAEAQADA